MTDPIQQLRSTTFEQLNRLLKEFFSYIPQLSAVGEDTVISKWVIGYELDSLDHVEMIMAIEDEFGIEINDPDADRAKTFGDLVSLIIEHRTVLHAATFSTSALGALAEAQIKPSTGKRRVSVTLTDAQYKTFMFLGGPTWLKSYLTRDE